MDLLPIASNTDIATRAPQMAVLLPLGSFEATRPVRSIVLNTVGLCSALALANEPDRASTVGGSVIHHGQRLTSRRLRDRIRNLSRDIPRDARHSGLADLRHTAIRVFSAA
ncbi:hypothetical protein ACQPYA_09360 [Micromonospora sp. CA-263727]|uniref:hypothetical protein n=1 Tax=Micromonospora sp. CA-263727 TaxID=3239967 RepID=UPI003D89DABC